MKVSTRTTHPYRRIELISHSSIQKMNQPGGLLYKNFSNNTENRIPYGMHDVCLLPEILCIELENMTESCYLRTYRSSTYACIVW